MRSSREWLAVYPAKCLYNLFRAFMEIDWNRAVVKSNCWASEKARLSDRRRMTRTVP